ncbi:MAG TPA: ABC transporter ATP-binding protein [Verrucomicrobiae bacterium]|nr:ABC transporter ATP-binding protein [Verrucomicrobiae bacterium]
MTTHAAAEPGAPLTAAAPLLEARGVSFRHHGARVPLFDRLSLRLAPGEFAGILGPNGSGKTTLLRLLAGLLRPDSGQVILEDAELEALSPRLRARSIAVVLQEPSLLFNFSVLEIALMGRAPHLGLWGLEGAGDFTAARRALAEVDLAGCEDRPVQELSSGERQRVFLARALAQEPRLLLLDEPTAFLDLRHALGLYEILRRLNRERGLTVVTVSHDLSLAARYAGRLILLNRGRIAADGAPGEVVTPARLRDVYGAETDVFLDPTTGTPVVIARGPALGPADGAERGPAA